MFADRVNSYRREGLKLRPPLLLDATMVVATLLLLGFGLLMVYSTTGIIAQEKHGDPWFFSKRQFFSAGLGLLIMFAFSRIKLSFLRRASPYLLIVCLVLLVLPLLAGFGERAGGASRWIRLAGLRFQPAEFVKLGLVVFLAGYFDRHHDQISSFIHGIVMPFLIVGLCAGLLLVQPDFGSAAIIAIVTLAMALAAGVRLRHILCCAIGLFILAGSLIVYSPYRMSRILAFTAPWADASGKGYQLIQSLIAVGSGHVTGVGLGAGQQKLFFLPAAHTDFIFAVIAEELGFVGCLVVIFLFLVLLWRGLMLAVSLVESTFNYTLAVGLTTLVVAPALLNIGVVTGLLPTKGLVLPLVGYGGSSLVACLAAIGLLLALARFHHQQHL